MDISDHVQAECGKPFALGSTDCAHFVAGWVKARTGRDALAIFDGLAAETAGDLVARRRLLRSFFEGCRSIGLMRASEPARGDVGVIRAAGRHRCAICSDRGWIYRDEGGVVFVAADLVNPLMAWKVD